jgi:hypothetical protein
MLNKNSVLCGYSKINRGFFNEIVSKLSKNTEGVFQQQMNNE